MIMDVVKENETSRSRIFPLVQGVVLMILAIICYMPALGADFIWDDDVYVDWPTMREGFDGLRKIWFEPGSTMQYYPVTYSAFWIQRRIWDLDPFGYHLLNVLLHAGNAVLLWRLLRRLGLKWGYFAAIIFAIHPVCVESVAWVCELKNTLSGMFYLLAGLAYLKFSPPEKHGPETARWRWCLVAGALFMLAVMTKTVTASWPAAIVLVLWWKRGGINWRDIAILSPFLIIGGLFGMLTAWMEVHNAGASGQDWSLSWGEKFILSGRALWFYAGKLVWPADLMFIYPRWRIDSSQWSQWLWTISAIILLAALFLLRGRIGRGPVTAVLFFAGTLFPALGFFNVYPFCFSFVADHFQYLASIGLISLAAAIFGDAVERLKNLWASSGGFLRLAGFLPAVAAFGIVAVFSILTAKQCMIYLDLKTLWSETLKKNPDCWLAWNNLGAMYLKNGPDKNPDIARSFFEEAIRIKDDFTDANYNLGLAYIELRQFDRAEELFTRVLKNDPANARARSKLGYVQIVMGRKEEGIRNLRKVMQQEPQSAAARFNLGGGLIEAGRPEEAIEYLRQGISVQPDSEIGWQYMGTACEKLGRIDEAIKSYKRCLNINPSNARASESLKRLISNESATHPVDGRRPGRTPESTPANIPSSAP